MNLNDGYDIFDFSKIWTANLLLANSLDEAIDTFQEYLQEKKIYLSLILEELIFIRDYNQKNIQKIKSFINSLSSMLKSIDYEFVTELATRVNPFLSEFISDKS